MFKHDNGVFFGLEISTLSLLSCRSTVRYENTLFRPQRWTYFYANVCTNSVQDVVATTAIHRPSTPSPPILI